MPHMTQAPTRRALLLGTSALFAWAQMPRLARAEGRDPRFMAIVLRGALDGLAAVAPVGDPDWHALRGDDALKRDGDGAGLPLDAIFALNPAMPNLHRLYQGGQATIVHAAATPYRDRSHFDGQDVLQTGATRPGALDSGWLNRAVASLAPEGTPDPNSRRAMAIGPVTPLIMRGPAPVLSWEIRNLPPVSDETTQRLLDLYRHTDPAFAQVLEARIGVEAIARAGGIEAAPKPANAMAQQQAQPRAAARVRDYFADAAGAAAQFLARADGPRIGALAFDGWDTHVNEGPNKGRLADLLGALDAAFAAIATHMGDAWKDTVVVAMTEFGRTARINGSGGTDHGTATVALLAGGAVKGGRVVADWPGLKAANLYQDRDLKPTTDLRAVVKGLLRDHLRVDERALAAQVFPDSAAARPISGLV
jgi:uncharacterized protein (DUF1501 family)